jgi:hypothetical protein
MSFMAEKKDRILLIVFAVYVALLVFATIGELFDVDWILDLFDLKKIFSA